MARTNQARHVLDEVPVMSSIALSPPSASNGDVAAVNLGNPGHVEVVEISLLLPSQWARDLIDLARQRRQSVGELIRAMIGHALHEGTSGN